ncbi:glycoside hydrolase family 88 protein [Dysgonomonas reticulitermitis]
MKYILNVFILFCTVCLHTHAQAGKTMNADGRTDTYKLIESFGYGVEVPDCGHSVKHITQVYDPELQKQVFAFTLHATLDYDRCGASDRQRTEIKTFGPSPESMKGYQGKTHLYKWKFKLDKDFRPSPNFCHIHQVKADAGPNAGAPIITLTPKITEKGKEVLQYHAVTAKNIPTILAEADLAQFKGVWVEATEKILHDRAGMVEIEIRRVSDGKILLKAKSKNADLWRDGARFNRPKYGIYRSLKAPSYLRDETVLYADIEFTELADKHQRQETGWDTAPELESKINTSFPAQTFNVADYGALGDNLHDNTPAFSHAIEICNKSGGGTVYVPRGMYKMDTSVKLLSNVRLQLSDGAILSFSPAVTYLIQCYGIENVSVTGPGKIRGSGKGGILLANSKNILIENCDIESGGDNISLQSGNTNENIIIKGNYFRKAQNSAIALGDATSGTIRNIFAENNTFGVIPGHIVQIKSSTGKIEDIRMRNNYSEGYPCRTAFHLEQATDQVKKTDNPVIWYGYFENFSNLNVSGNAIYFKSLPKNTEPIESMWFNNIQVTGTKDKDMVIRDQTRDIYITNIGPKASELNDITANAVSWAKLDYIPGKAPVFWSIAAAQSTIARYPDFTQTYWNAWTYVNGYMACVFERLYKDTGDKTYLEYIKRYIDTFIDSEGNLVPVANNKGIARVPNVCDNLDNMMLGNTVVMLYEHYKDERYRKVADYIHSCFKNYPRNNDGGFWHGRGLHGQMWIDGIFMGQMFLLRYGRSIGDADNAYDEATRQIVAYSKTGEKDNSGLYVHGVYEPGHGDRECRWATAENRQSSDVWGEGLGWYALVIIEALETIPPANKGYNDVKNIYLRLSEALKRTQDPKTGGWFQVVDKTDMPDNWIETSGTAMFTYSIAQGINLGLLDEKEYGQVVKDGYKSIVNHAKINEKGLVDVYEACDGVGVQTDYEKYIHYKRSLNAKEAYVGFVWATEIVERNAIKVKK